MRARPCFVTKRSVYEVRVALKLNANLALIDPRNYMVEPLVNALFDLMQRTSRAFAHLTSGIVSAWAHVSAKKHQSRELANLPVP
jgi:hypothetical protein